MPQQTWVPTANAASYRDLLRFEQRLLQNAETLARSRRRWQGFLVASGLCSMWLAYLIWIQPSKYLLLHYTYISLLLICVTTVGLFFATGMHSEKIARAYKYVPQANRSLRPFNMHLNTRVSTSYWPWSRRKNAIAQADLQMRRKSSTRISPPSSPDKQDRPLSPSNRQPLQNMPPASNPRGEIVFSNRIDPTFRQGYERYRAEWERRQKGGAAPATQSTDSPLTGQSEKQHLKLESRMNSSSTVTVIGNPVRSLKEEHSANSPAPARGRTLARSRSPSPA